MSTATEKVSDSDLRMFTGTEGYHRWSVLFRHHVLTDGAKYLAEKCGAYWLMDAIASHHASAMRDPRLREMQIWFLRKNKTNDGVNLTCWADTGQGEKHKILQRIPYSDFFNNFDGDEIKLYVEPMENLWVVMLPSER